MYVLCTCVLSSCFTLYQNYPENSIAAFGGTSANIDSVTTLETDVHIRYELYSIFSSVSCCVLKIATTVYRFCYTMTPLQGQLILGANVQTFLL